MDGTFCDHWSLVILRNTKSVTGADGIAQERSLKKGSRVAAAEAQTRRRFCSLSVVEDTDAGPV